MNAWQTGNNNGGQNVTNYDSLLGGRATPSASFKGQFPILWEGTVEDVTKKPAYEYDPSKPNNRGAQKFWDDGNPVENLWITLQTNVRVDQDDDGRRVLVLDSRNKLEAVQSAVRESGASFAQGGRLTIEWYGNDTVNAKNPDNPPKLYRARYSAPTFDAALGQNAPAQQYAQQNTAQAGWGAPAAPPQAAPPAPAWGAPAPSTPPSAPAPAAGGWGAPAPAQAPAQGGWGQPAPQAPPAPQPLPADPVAAGEALRRKGVDTSQITSQQQAEQIWAMVQHQPDVTA